MKKLIVILALFAIGFLIRNALVSNQQKPVTIAEPRQRKFVSQPKPRLESLPATNASLSSELDQLTSRIQSLQNKKEELKHILEMQGFPQILNDDRLSETERSELLKKLAQLNDLDLHLVRLKNQKLEMETEVSL